MSLVVSDMMPLDLHPALHWLGRQNPKWLRIADHPESNPDIPRTLIQCDFSYLPFNYSNGQVLKNGQTMQLSAAERMAKILNKAEKELGGQLSFCVLEAWGRLLADGPKLFMPTEEQFESMGHVELRIPVNDLHLPYPAMVIGIPPEFRKRLAKAVGLDPAHCPRGILVRRRHEKDWDERICFVVGMNFPTDEQYYVFSAQNFFATAEDAITRWIMRPGDDVKKHEFSTVCCRAALNLAMMLTHYGHKLVGPVDPVQHQRHRKAHLAKFRHNDFLAVRLTQEVTVRKIVDRPPPGDDGNVATMPGRDMSPHWRRGHWRRERGFREILGSGGVPKLSFVRPCFIRRDRLDGDPGDITVTYHGK